jgi:putative membrane protein
MCNIQKAILPLAIAALCSLGAFAQTSSSQSKTSTGTEHMTTKTEAMGAHSFLREAGYADLAEVQLGQLAEQKASSPEVKQFAERMVTDHTKNDDQLKQVAKQEGVMLPDKLSAKDEATKARLDKLSGKEFDHAYMLDMVRDHTTDVAKFKDESKENLAPAVKNYVDQTLPTLESHLKEAHSVEPQTARAVHKNGTSKAS